MLRETEGCDSEVESSCDVPTVRPPAEVSVVRYKVGVPVDELLYRIEMGDTAGALDAAQTLLDEEPLPIVMMPSTLSAELLLGHREEYLLGFIDGHATLEEVIRSTGMSMLEALRALCGLLDKRVIALR